VVAPAFCGLHQAEVDKRVQVLPAGLGGGKANHLWNSEASFAEEDLPEKEPERVPLEELIEFLFFFFGKSGREEKVLGRVLAIRVQAATP
jgi:hypothetical protein